jgi:hypothetical protein
LPGKEFRDLAAELTIPARTLDDPSFELYDPEARVVLGHVFQVYSRKKDAAKLTFLACDENVFGQYCQQQPFSRLLERGSAIVREYAPEKSQKNPSSEKTIPSVEISSAKVTSNPAPQVNISQDGITQRIPLQEEISTLEDRLRQSGKII